MTAAEDKLKRLYRMVEGGVTDLDDILREGLDVLKKERDRAKAALDRVRVADRPPAIIAPELIERFGTLMCENITTGEIPFREAWLQSIVDRVEVGSDLIRIVDDTANLETAIAGSGNAGTPGVRSSVRTWRTRHDSNV